MKVLVINEPFIKDFCRTQRWAARTRGRVLRAPDWLAYTTGVLEESGILVELYDFPAMGWDKVKFKELVKEKQPDFVVLDSTTPSIYSDIYCAKLVKEVSSAKVIMVGPHVSALPEETLKEAKGSVDVVAIGEHDYTVRDIVKSFPDLSNIKGIAYIDNSDIKITLPRPLIEDLDSLPFPAWHHLDLMRYFDGLKLYPYIDIISGRGCPHRCIFCLWPQVMHGRRYRFRSPENVVDEIERDIKICPQVLKGGEFFFEDDTFTVNKTRAIAICEEIIRRNLKITFSINARFDISDLEFLKLMKKAGCRELLVGFESGVQEILDNMKKRATIEQAKKFMYLVHKAKLVVHGCFVFGLPGETKETMERTINFALNLGLDSVQFSAAVPFPGTEYYEYCKENKLLRAKDWSDWLFEGEQATIVEYPNLSRRDIEYYVNLGLKKFYFRPVYLFEFALKSKNFSDFYRKLKGGWSFFSYLLFAPKR